jgi:hypothetical protein
LQLPAGFGAACTSVCSVVICIAYKAALMLCALQMPSQHMHLLRLAVACAQKSFCSLVFLGSCLNSAQCADVHGTCENK